MHSEQSHLSDRDLLLEADGELSASESARVRSHLSACWTCRTRRQELNDAVGDFVRAYRRTIDPQVHSPDGPRALLRARINQLEKSGSEGWQISLRGTFGRWVFGALIAACIVLIALIVYPSLAPHHVLASTVTVPDPRLTPGAAVLVDRERVCRTANTKNKAVPRELERAVLKEYGLGSAEVRAYEVDYLITPGLGGADDIHNLWPESNSATIWNAHVKDSLEDHLRDLVCRGEVDLATAQREIAVNWIEAYKKYFHTDRPLAEDLHDRR